MADHKGTLKNELDDFSMKTKLLLPRFGELLERQDMKKNLFLIHFQDTHFIGIKNLLMHFKLIAHVYKLVIKF